MNWLIDSSSPPATGWQQKGGSHAIFLRTGHLDLVIFSSTQECDNSKWWLWKQNSTWVFLPLKTSEPSATAKTPHPFYQAKRNLDSYLVQKYPSILCKAFVFPGKVISFVLKWPARWSPATFSSQQPKHPTERPVEIASIATRTQSLVGSPTRCVNTADWVQQGSGAKQAVPMHGTGPESEHSPTARCPLAALIWFWDCFIFCVSVTKRSARRKAADSIRWWEIISGRDCNRFYKPPPGGGRRWKRKTATCPVWIHRMWTQCREDNHFKRLN